jgi:urease accessory protein
MKRFIWVAGLIAFSQSASAHTGLLSTGGFSHGFQHPFLGLDHFLVMLGLGLWASSQARLLAKQAIGVFLLFMTLGALFGLAGFGFAYVETTIIVSLLWVGITLSLPINNVKSGVQAMQSWRVAPLVNILCIRDVARPTLHSQAARGNEYGRALKAIILTPIAVFAAMHGLAHGSEVPVDASAYAYMAGIISATAVLHLSGLALGFIVRRIDAAGLIHIYGAMTGLIGAWLLFA